MFKINEYFDGSVKSIAYSNDKGPATLGVMAPGEYTFNTTTREVMHVIDGAIDLLEENGTAWVCYPAGTHFTVNAGSCFKVRIHQNTAYLCRYGDE